MDDSSKAGVRDAEIREQNLVNLDFALSHLRCVSEIIEEMKPMKTVPLSSLTAATESILELEKRLRQLRLEASVRLPS